MLLKLGLEPSKSSLLIGESPIEAFQRAEEGTEGTRQDDPVNLAMASSAEERVPNGPVPGESSGSMSPALNPSIRQIEDRFLFDGTKFGDLSFDGIPVAGLDRIGEQIRLYQVQEQQAFFETLDMASTRTLTEEEYVKQQLWLFTDMMVFPVRRDGVLSGDCLIVEKQACPTVYGLREMLRVVRDTPAYARRQETRYQDFLDGVLEKFPNATPVENADRTVVYVYDTDGAIRGTYRLSTVGNF